MMKRVMALMLVISMVVSGSAVLAQNDNDRSFKDVAKNHWADKAIELMVSKGIISGHEGYFRPDDSVSKEEFAKMLVKTLGLSEIRPATPTFMDVGKNDWAYTYVETAKKYLTGYTSGNGFKFKPDEASVREDMAVAVIKGLYDKGEVDNPDTTDLSVLDGYKDQKSVSANLRKYVAAAINEGIMVGDDGEFNPMGNLTRAQAATLLARLIDAEQKVVFDDEDKVVVDDATTLPAPIGGQTPVLEKTVRDNDVVLEWSQVKSSGFKYYKVVLSKGDSSPSYSENGYAKAISNVASTRVEIDNGMSYKGGDFGGVIKGGETYYMAITAVYDNGKYTSNVQRVTVPGVYEAPDEDARTPDLNLLVSDNDVVVEWTKVPGQGFKYYKVVLSGDDSTPSYPANGYAMAISNVDNNRAKLTSGDKYNGGDLGGMIKGGQSYHVAITAVYTDGSYTSNVKKITVPGTYESPSIGERTPKLSYDLESKGVELNWTQSPSSGFSYYKVVLSQTKNNPYYPDYGYLTYISDSSKTSYMVYDGAGYNDGNLGGIGGHVEDESYYMTITAVYKDGKYTSNSVYVTVPDK